MPATPPTPSRWVRPNSPRPRSKEFAGLVTTGSGPRKVHGFVFEAKSSGRSSSSISSPSTEVARTLICGGSRRMRFQARSEVVR